MIENADDNDILNIAIVACVVCIALVLCVAIPAAYFLFTTVTGGA